MRRSKPPLYSITSSARTSSMVAVRTSTWAAKAVHAAHAADAAKASALREAEERWQLQCLIDRLLPGDLEDWSLPKSTGSNASASGQGR